MQLILRSFDLKLKHTFKISRYSFDIKRTLIVELRDDIFSGFGEASENPYYNKTIEIMVNDLSLHREFIENLSDETPEEVWIKMYPLLKDNMFALCALDLAYNDLYARKKGKKLYELWGYKTDNNPLTNYTIGIDTIENMVLKIKETPWPLYKIKLGTKEDLKIVQALRKETDAVFRIDANCAWGVDESVYNAKELQKLHVEFIEQPLPAEDWEGAKVVYEQSVLPIIADESCQIEQDVEKCVGHFHGINIKLVKCGGLTSARRMIRQAKGKNLRTMVGCMTESNVGMSAIAHLLPELNYVDMDGSLLLKEDIAEGITLEHGRIIYSDENGIGSKLKNINPKLMIK
jgi:L-alanine-DL-glutamate epimerase-like enolase superfamily enzyme